jgi:hypothetical protein
MATSAPKRPLLSEFAYIFTGLDKNGHPRKAAQVLALQPAMQTLASGTPVPAGSTPPAATKALRVVGCEVLQSGGWGKFKLYGTRETFVDMILSTPAKNRHFAAVTLDHTKLPKSNGGDRLYAFLDCEARGAPWTNAPRSIPALLDALGFFYCKTFASTFPQAPVWDWSDLWVFSKEAKKEVSLHLHSTQCVWDSAEEQKAFMQILKLRIEEAVSDTTHPDNKIASVICIKGDDLKVDHFVDWSVYSDTQFMKLPLCRKYGKACMTLLKAPARWKQETPTERSQLEAGMIVATTYDPKKLLKVPLHKRVVEEKRKMKRKHPTFGSSDKPEMTGLRLTPKKMSLLVSFTKHEVDANRSSLTKSFPPTMYCVAPHNTECCLARRIHTSVGNVNYSKIVWSKTNGRVTVTTACYSPKCPQSQRTETSITCQSMVERLVYLFRPKSQNTNKKQKNSL